MKKSKSLKTLSFLILCFLLGVYGISCKEDTSNSKTPKNFSGILPDEADEYDSSNLKWGFIDKKGKLIIEDRFDDALNFSEGIAAVRIKGKWGYIDKSGEWIVKPSFKTVWSFSDGLGRVMTFEQKMGFVDKNGDWAIDAIFEEAGDFSEGLAEIKAGHFYHFINSVGDTIIKDNFSRASSFQNGFASVQKKRRYGLINIEGKKVLDFEYSKIGSLSDDCFRVKKEEKYGFVDNTGKTILPLVFQMASDFNNNRAAAKMDSLYYLIDKKGNKRSNGFDLMDYAGENLWRIQKGNLFGLLDSNGKILVEPTFEEIRHFEEGLCLYYQNKLWGFMNPKGEFVTKAIFSMLWNHKEDQARFIAPRQGIGFVDKQGKVSIAPQFIDVRDFYEGLARVLVY